MVIVGVGFVIVIGGLMLLEHCKCVVIVICHRLRRPGSIGSSDSVFIYLSLSLLIVGLSVLRSVRGARSESRNRPYHS